MTSRPWTMTRCSCGHEMCSAWRVSCVDLGGLTREAEAKLIVAAPDLLLALKLILPRLRELDEYIHEDRDRSDHEQCFVPEISLVENLIAKAQL